MSWCCIRICRDIIIRVTQHFRPKSYLISCSEPHPQGCCQIFSVKIGVKINPITLPLNSQRVSRSILVQSCQMNLTQSCQQERKLIMQTKETILCRIIYTKSSPKPPDNRSSYYRQCTGLTSNDSPSPQAHLTPRKNISNESSENHYQQNHNSNLPNKFSRLCIASIIQPTKQMHINHNKEKTPSIGMQITQQPSVRNITHQMLNTVECLIYMSSVMHCQKNSCPNLKNLAKTPQDPPVIISILIGRSGITNQMILHDTEQRLIQQTSTIFESFHSRKKERKKQMNFSFDLEKILREFEEPPFGNQLHVA